MDLEKIDRLYTSLSTTWLIRITEEEDEKQRID